MELKKIFKKAKKEGWAIGQFNFSTLEQLRGIASAAKKTLSPVILGTSENESRFLGLEETIALVRILENKESNDFFLHLDHGRDLDYIKKAIDLGYDSVHFDGSGLSFEKNLKLTKEIADHAHKKDVFVEGELGYLRGKSGFQKGKIKLSKKDLTKPEEVEEFVSKTRINSLAIAIGNVHGIYLKMPQIDFERLKEIREKTNTFLVLHGGSGIAENEIKDCIRFGIQKININTELRLTWKGVLQKSLEESKEIKPYIILPQVSEAIEKKVEKYIKLFGSHNKLYNG